MTELLRGPRVWLLPLLLAGVVAFVGWWAHREVQRVIEREISDVLQATLEANVTALEIWMENQKRMAMGLAVEPRLQGLMLTLLGGETDNGSRPARAEALRELMNGEQLRERTRVFGYGVAQLVNTNLIIVASTFPGRARLDHPVPEELQPRYADVFASGKPVILTPFKPPIAAPPRRAPVAGGSEPRDFRPRGPEGQPGGRGPRQPPAGPPRTRDYSVMQVAAPVKDAAGITRGVLALMINPDAEFTRILSVARPGESGETFAFDPEGVLLSESRFDDMLKRAGLLEDTPDARSALNLRLLDPGVDLTTGSEKVPEAGQPLVKMVARALQGEGSVELKPFRDYRGVPVVGAWRWLPEYGFGVGTKMDAREAFRPLRLVTRVFMILFLLLVLASLIILLFSYKQRVWRQRLTEAELLARQLGQYTLTQRIGAGGMGVVYKAQHALLRRQTAIKMLPPESSDAGAIARFEQEVQLTCRLSHPNTIQVYDYGRTPDGLFYYAMEYLEGLHLGELVARYGPQPEGRVIHILRQVCGSLGEAHRLGLIHRDIKPANVFLCDRGGVADSVKVLDFGLVQRLEVAVGRNGGTMAGRRNPEADSVVGTPNFIAPESLCEPPQFGVRSDLYAVGALGYLLLTGHYVFEGTSVADLSRKHLSEPPVPPGTRRGEPVCAHIESIILRCLEKDPGRRPASAEELEGLLDASPRAAEWTTELRAAWWTRHRSNPSGNRKPETSSATGWSEATVRIALDARAQS